MCSQALLLRASRRMRAAVSRAGRGKARNFNRVGSSSSPLKETRPLEDNRHPPLGRSTRIFISPCSYRRSLLDGATGNQLTCPPLHPLRSVLRKVVAKSKVAVSGHVQMGLRDGLGVAPSPPPPTLSLSVSSIISVPCRRPVSESNGPESSSFRATAFEQTERTGSIKCNVSSQTYTSLLSCFLLHSGGRGGGGRQALLWTCTPGPAVVSYIYPVENGAREITVSMTSTQPGRRDMCAHPCSRGRDQSCAHAATAPYFFFFAQQPDSLPWTSRGGGFLDRVQGSS